MRANLSNMLKSNHRGISLRYGTKRRRIHKLKPPHNKYPIQTIYHTHFDNTL